MGDDSFQAFLRESEALYGPPPDRPLCEAIRRGDVLMVRKRSLRVEGKLTLRAKREAILLGRRDFLKLLLDRDNIIAEHTMEAACNKKDRQMIRMLLDYGWPIDRGINFGCSILFYATDDLDFMQWLVENGANVNARNNLDQSALSGAIAHGDLNVVHYLLAQGTVITHGDLLYSAAERPNRHEGADLTELLIQRGASVNAYRCYDPIALRWRGMSALLTPLHIACQHGNTPVTRILLQHGADPHRKILEAGKPAHPTPLESATRSNNTELVKLMAVYDSSAPRAK